MSTRAIFRLAGGLAALGLALGATLLHWITELGRIASTVAPETHPAVWARAAIAFVIVALALAVAAITYIDGRTR